MKIETSRQIYDWPAYIDLTWHIYVPFLGSKLSYKAQGGKLTKPQQQQQQPGKGRMMLREEEGREQHTFKLRSCCCCLFALFTATIVFLTHQFLDSSNT